MSLGSVKIRLNSRIIGMIKFSWLLISSFSLLNSLFRKDSKMRILTLDHHHAHPYHNHVMAVRLVLIRLRYMVHLLAGPMNGTIMLMIEMTTLLMRLLVIITPVSNQPWPLILNKKDKLRLCCHRRLQILYVLVYDLLVVNLDQSFPSL